MLYWTSDWWPLRLKVLVKKAHERQNGFNFSRRRLTCPNARYLWASAFRMCSNKIFVLWAVLVAIVVSNEPVDRSQRTPVFVRPEAKLDLSFSCAYGLMLWADSTDLGAVGKNCFLTLPINVANFSSSRVVNFRLWRPEMFRTSHAGRCQLITSVLKRLGGVMIGFEFV